MAKMAAAKMVKIEAPFYQEGTRVFIFDVTGLPLQEMGQARQEPAEATVKAKKGAKR
jgi:hypothetical protein